MDGKYRWIGSENYSKANAPNKPDKRSLKISRKIYINSESNVSIDMPSASAL